MHNEAETTQSALHAQLRCGLRFHVLMIRHKERPTETARAACMCFYTCESTDNRRIVTLIAAVVGRIMVNEGDLNRTTYLRIGQSVLPPIDITARATD